MWVDLHKIAHAHFPLDVATAHAYRSTDFFPLILEVRKKTTRTSVYMHIKH